MIWSDFKKELKRCGLTQLEFSKQVGASRTTITRWKSDGLPQWVELWLIGYKKANGIQEKLPKVTKEVEEAREEIFNFKPKSYKEFKGYPSLEEVKKSLRSANDQERI